mmetsp:Transcript_6126/g.15763  ORF Transcript_6126/g.15763 Transcript_6126/m.15763 type:complete len:100 (+) Transcript_6126:835-1134(+)
MNLANIKRDVIMRYNESLVQATEKYLDAKKADLVIIGSNGLMMDKNKDKGVVLGSVTLTMARQLLYPILIVKPSRACQLHILTEAQLGVRPTAASSVLG